MNNRTIIASVAGLATLAHASNDEGFTDFQARFNKSYRTVRELSSHQRQYQENLGIINSVNERSRGSTDPNALKLAVNQFADMSQAEFARHTGRASGTPQSNSGERPHARQGLQADVTQSHVIDHERDGWLTGVKDQGSCGSCYVFSAASTLEGIIAIKN